MIAEQPAILSEMPSDPRVLLLCYYYAPSREVASRRVGAYARTLAANGYAVTVVSAFGDAPLAHGVELSPGVRALPVPMPPRLLTPWLVKLKSLVTGRKGPDAGNGTGAAGAPAAGAPPAASADSSGGGLLHGLSTRILKALDVIDAFKRWSLHAVDASLADAREYPVHAVVASGPQF